MLLAVVSLWRRRPSALLWLIVTGGGGIYLFALDVLYDLRPTFVVIPTGG